MESLTECGISASWSKSSGNEDMLFALMKFVAYNFTGILE